MGIGIIRYKKKFITMDTPEILPKFQSFKIVPNFKI